MQLSLGETETLVTRATRGFGLSWGLAQEAGRAASQLAAFGLPAVEVFADLFRQSAGIRYEARRPMINNGQWVADGPALCPIVLGSAISDRRESLVGHDGHSITTGPVFCPVIVAAMMSLYLAGSGKTIHLAWSSVCIQLSDDESLNATRALTPVAHQAGALTVSGAGSQAGQAARLVSYKPVRSRSVTKRAPYEALLALARLTYVPATGDAGTKIQAD